MTDKEKTAIILGRLILRESQKDYLIKIPEFRFGSSYNGGVSQRQIDLFEIDVRRCTETTSYEIKVSRADFLKDIKDPLKQRGARMFSNYFFYCAPKGLIKPDELPVWAGLLEFDLDIKEPSESWSGFYGQYTVAPPLLEREPPTWGMIISALRRADKTIMSRRLKYKPE